MKHLAIMFILSVLSILSIAQEKPSAALVQQGISAGQTQQQTGGKMPVNEHPNVSKDTTPMGPLDWVIDDTWRPCPSSPLWAEGNSPMPCQRGRVHVHVEGIGVNAPRPATRAIPMPDGTVLLVAD